MYALSKHSVKEEYTFASRHSMSDTTNSDGNVWSVQTAWDNGDVLGRSPGWIASKPTTMRLKSAPKNESRSSLAKHINHQHQPESIVMVPLESGSSTPTTDPLHQQHPRAPNPDFQDVQATGRWGQVSKKDIIIAVLVVVVMVTAMAFALVVYVPDHSSTKESPRGDSTGLQTSSTSSSSSSSAWSSNAAGTTVPVPSPDALYQTLRDALEGTPATFRYAKLLRSPWDSLLYQQYNESQHPFVRAAAWIMFEDKVNINSATTITTKYTTTTTVVTYRDIVDRFALATIYYAQGGPTWELAGNWLSATSVCKWDGIYCLGTSNIQEIDLSHNNLTGTISEAYSLIQTTQSISLGRNHMEGTIPGKVFGCMPNLSILYLQDNQLTGTIPSSLRDNYVLGTLYLQGNNLTGIWPPQFCASGPNLPPLFREFGTNCRQTPCPTWCCKPLFNCFA